MIFKQDEYWRIGIHRSQAILHHWTRRDDGFGDLVLHINGRLLWPVEAARNALLTASWREISAPEGRGNLLFYFRFTSQTLSPEWRKVPFFKASLTLQAERNFSTETLTKHALARASGYESIFHTPLALWHLDTTDPETCWLWHS